LHAFYAEDVLTVIFLLSAPLSTHRWAVLIVL